MFLRRVFARKDQTESQEKNSNGISRSNTVNHDSPYRLMRRNSIANDEKQQRSLTMIQLTPLWEHIIRMKRLPDNVNEKDMFSEFAERLRDPEWQVRQHALKVLIDVLIVMRERSDQFFEPLVCPLVENLGHSAPAIRKGALDVLKVYMTETEMPETVILEIIDSGMEQKKYFKQFDGRVCVGVMLSLPSLLYTSLGTSKQNHIVRAVIEALTSKMVQVTYQEIALKVLLRIREMIGAREFSEHIAHGAYRDFELLCNVYGLPSTPDTQDPSVDLYKPQNATENSRVWNPSSQVNESNCKVKRTELCWRDKQDEISADDEENNNSVTKQFNCNGINSDNKSCTQSVHVNVMTKKSDNEKIIMETEIKIQDTALTMRILEANSNSSENDVPGEISEDDLSSVYEHNGVVRILTDSELDDSNNTVIEVLDSSRNPLKRVTFGGEEVKLRTPDSDSVLQSDNDDAQKAIQVLTERKTTNELEIKTATLNIDREIADNLLKKPNSSTIRPQTASIIITTSSPPASNDETDKAMKIRHKSASPGRRSRRPSFSSADEAIISPKGAHKGIEVLHNLQQRSPSVSPIRSRQNSLIDNKMNSISDKNINVIDSQDSNKFEDDIIVEEISSPEMNRKLSEPKKSWENLGLVDEVCLRNAKSGDWRLRLKAMGMIEEMLKSTENLSKVRPHLESLFRTLLSSEKHQDVIEEKRRIIINLISRLPLDNLEERATQVLVGLCRQGGPGSNRVAKALMQRLPPTVVVIKLTSDDFLKSHSSRFRENALQMVLYSLMTFPSTYFDISTCVRKSAEAANDQKKRVRQAALDVLAVLGQISSPKLVLDEVIETLKHEEESQRLVAAVKARLSRKQLPTVTPDGNVQYALRIPTPPQTISNHYFGADIDWITAGLGSVSPISAKKRFDPMQQFYNYSSSDSNRSTTDIIRRTTKDLSAYHMGSSSEYEYGNYGFQRPHEDKNTHFVIATAIPSHHMSHSINSDLQKINSQSHSFPDLSKKVDLKIGPYTNSKLSPFQSSYKSSRVPVASRFPSMESNMEARNVSNQNKSEQSFSTVINNRYSSNQSYAFRPNGSLPRKFNANTNIPIRNAYYNYSHGALNTQSDTDDTRPSTHPTETIQPLQKRFVNIDKYLLDESTNESSTPEKSYNIVRYNNQIKSPTRERMDELNRLKIQQTQQAMNQMVIEKNVMDNNKSINIPTKESSVRVLHDIMKSSSKNSIESYSESGEAYNDENDHIRPHSHASSVTTKSIQDEVSGIDSQSKTAASVGVSSIEEILTGKSNATSAENLDNLSAVESEAIDTSLEHIQNESNEKLMAADPDSDSKSVNNLMTVNIVDDEKTNEIMVKTQQPDQLLGSLFVDVAKPNEIDDHETRFDSDSRSLSSTESSEYPVLRECTAKTLTVPISEQKVFNKPVPKLKPAIITRRNRVTPVKSYPSSATTHAASAPIMKSTEIFPNHLRKFDKPRDASNNCLNQLENQNWEVTMNGLQNFVRLIRHHPEVIETNLHAYCVALSKHVKNLRSQVSRSACQASAEFFQTHARHLETESEDLATQLLNRTADTNKFLRADAFRALAAMCDNLSPPKVIQTILTRGASHQNAVVRTAAANLCSRIVGRLGCEKIFAMHREHRDKLILASANFLMEGSLDTRNNAKAIFKQLSTHPNYNRVLHDVIPSRIYRNIEKALRAVK